MDTDDLYAVISIDDVTRLSRIGIQNLVINFIDNLLNFLNRDSNIRKITELIKLSIDQIQLSLIQIQIIQLLIDINDLILDDDNLIFNDTDITCRFSKLIHPINQLNKFFHIFSYLYESTRVHFSRIAHTKGTSFRWLSLYYCCAISG